MLRQLIFISLLLTGIILPAAADPAVAPPLDLVPLKKALAPLNDAGVLKAHTRILISGSSQGTPFTLHEALLVTARRPGRFHAELTQFDSQGAPKKRLVIISNGTTVWTYRPGLKQYSVMSLEAFNEANSDVPTLGLIVGGFYLGSGHVMVQGFRGITPGNSDAILAALSGMDITLSRHSEAVSNQDDYVYSMVLSKQQLTYQFYVNNETNALNRVDLAGIEDGTQVSYREDLARMTPLAIVPKSIFTFTPPQGTTKTATVSLDPF